ncbi:Copper amine oxidase N-terminal domain-containing protein [Sporobacter termitidis DSM 10068]|uniref:Copper amine oxidase N-terminal domain-containing protein n=1 Tax=Sporobacter termitidis DSM 10068 TaxID=1123282 RepID=A0A1M5XXG3_9FIRM|nr:hypothetical protein [Sporobacter termitidis]SHI04379.1 Copper amine oxidase N-terminal domain-containing protein [Sporobacter termitidis DSM 10068]
MRLIKKTFSMLLTAALLVSALVTTSYAAGVKATPTASTVKINNYPYAFQAYTIDGNNYFKLRDLAMILSGTNVKFSVSWDGSNNSIYMLAPGYYAPLGDEMTVSGETSVVDATATTSSVYLNGKQIKLAAYTIGGYNYFKLRDIGGAMNFSVAYDSKTDTINVDTYEEYYMPALLEILPDAYYDEANETIHTYLTDTGYITITRYNNTYYSVAASNISSENDYTLLKNIVNVFVGDSDAVIKALADSKDEGRKEIQVDGKNLTCYIVGLNQTIDIKW